MVRVHRHRLGLHVRRCLHRDHRSTGSRRPTGGLPSSAERSDRVRIGPRVTHHEFVRAHSAGPVHRSAGRATRVNRLNYARFTVLARRRTRGFRVLIGLVLICTACTKAGSPPPTVAATSQGASAGSDGPPASAEPTGSSGRQLPGVARPICHVSTARVDLGLGGPAKDRVYEFSRLVDGACDHLRATVAVAADRGPVEVVSSRAARCHPNCRIIATPDINADGVPELAVGQRGAYASFFSLFMLERAPLAVTLLHPEERSNVEFAVGGTTQSMWGLICGPGPTLTTWGAGATREGSGPYSVGVVTYRLPGARLVRVSGHRSLVPQGDPSLLPEDGGVAFGKSTGICGAALLPASK